jgi:hypothetical protein
VISFIGNRPALQIGHCQVIDYDTSWLDDALHRAAEAADHGDFPFLEEIRTGVEQYLETQCPLRLLQIEELFDKIRRMLMAVGCEQIATHLELLAPPVTVSLVQTARQAGNAFELAFFNALRGELAALRGSGAEEIRFTGLRECILILRGSVKWDKRCEATRREIRAFLAALDREPNRTSRPLRLHLETDR